MISIINISLLRDGILKEKLVCYKEMEAPWHLSVQSERRRCGQILPPVPSTENMNMRKGALGWS
ncbi:hypothetical protein M758_4G089300 [Ceratodon purpureus]|nr:hypothetical protein M758_4G089300 [Ceratodon purpureus]